MPKFLILIEFFVLGRYRSSRIFSLCISLLIVSGAEAKPDQFNVNFYGRHGKPPEGWKELVTLAPGQEAGVAPWNSDVWNNMLATRSTIEITSTGNKTATFKITQVRNGGSFSVKKLRPKNTHEDGNATLLDGHLNTTEDPGDGKKTGILEVEDIPYKAYHLVVYFRLQRAQGFDGKGWITINDSIHKQFTLDRSTPKWEFSQITNPSQPGNYMVIPGLSGEKLKIEMAGENFTHLGAAGLQIIEATEARKTIEITKIAKDKLGKKLSVTWNSAPGDAYSMRYSEDKKNYYPFGKPVILASKKGYSTTLVGIPNPAPTAAELFIQLEDADYDDPEWNNAGGVGKLITLDFSEPLWSKVATDHSNYTVKNDKDQKLALSSARVGKTKNSIQLELTAPMAANQIYSVHVDNLVDNAGRKLTGPKTKSFKTWDNQPNGVKVIILAGQSNMEGFGQTELGNDKIEGGLGSLRHLVATQPEKYGRLVDKRNHWKSRKDVKFWWNKGNQIIKGNLSIGQGSNDTRIGPEFAAGQIMGDYFEEPVLIIKTAWGGKSLFVDFRPPTAVSKRGGKVGFYYREMLNNIHQVLDNFSNEYPEFAGMGYDIVGFGWHQGYNDSLSDSPATEYAENMADFIGDIRAEFGKPLLPFSLATIGHRGEQQSGTPLILTESQLSILDAAKFPQLKGNVTSTDTRPFWREGNVSPMNQGYHWNHNAETYYEIGEALANGLKKLITKK